MVVLGRAWSQVALNSGSLHFQTFPSSLWRTQHPLLHTQVSLSPLFSGQAQATLLLPCVSIVSGSVFVHDPLQSDLMIPSSLLPLLPSLSICPLLAPPQRPRTKFSKSVKNKDPITSFSQQVWVPFTFPPTKNIFAQEPSPSQLFTASFNPTPLLQYFSYKNVTTSSLPNHHMTWPKASPLPESASILISFCFLHQSLFSSNSQTWPLFCSFCHCSHSHP